MIAADRIPAVGYAYIGDDDALFRWVPEAGQLADTRSPKKDLTGNPRQLTRVMALVDIACSLRLSKKIGAQPLHLHQICVGLVDQRVITRLQL